jgi:DNA processing protein
LWRHIEKPPKLVTVAGNSEHLPRRALAIVGTRQATPRGLAIAERLAADLVQAGWVIVSGLAYGIDSAAHRGALAAGGHTVAVMATGCDRTYPAGHRQLRRQIEQQGCVVTEEADGTLPQKYLFPKRNRLIAGLVEGLVVVEAPRHSGALLTARWALDFGREVMAVPGPIDQVQSRGCHQLLKEGAALVESVADIHQLLAAPAPLAAGATAAALPELEAILVQLGRNARWIWDRLDLGDQPLASLQQGWRGSVAEWSTGLLALEMAGLIRRLPGGRLARRIWRP